jgi:hypothetical protein
VTVDQRSGFQHAREQFRQILDQGQLLDICTCYPDWRAFAGGLKFARRRRADEDEKKHAGREIARRGGQHHVDDGAQCQRFYHQSGFFAHLAHGGLMGRFARLDVPA